VSGGTVDWGDIRRRALLSAIHRVSHSPANGKNFDAEDLAQEAVITLFTGKNPVRPGRGLPALIDRVVVSKLYDMWRKDCGRSGERREFLDIDEMTVPLTNGLMPSPQDFVEIEERVASLLRTTDARDGRKPKKATADKYARLVFAIAVEGRPSKKTGAEMGLGEAETSRIVSAAKRRLHADHK